MVDNLRAGEDGGKINLTKGFNGNISRLRTPGENENKKQLI